MSKIGLFGGTFDPIHAGHLYIAQACAKQLSLDSVIFLPAGSPYHKQNLLGTSAQHRLAMVQIAIAENSRFAVSDCDVVREGKTYTYDTVEIFRQYYPQSSLYWLMGMDSLMQLHTWYKWQEWVQRVNIVVVARSGSIFADVPTQLQSWLGAALAKGELYVLDVPPMNVSSTHIREVLLSGGDAGTLLPKGVMDYIRKHGLYQ